jgi:tRNA(fMet)-specific endonuclease VapC
LNQAKKARNLHDEVHYYRRLRLHLDLCQTLRILDFDERAATEFQRLKKKYPRLGTMDLKIAAIALANRATLLSRNLRHFQQIADLNVQDWTEAEDKP